MYGKALVLKYAGQREGGEAVIGRCLRAGRQPPEVSAYRAYAPLTATRISKQFYAFFRSFHLISTYLFVYKRCAWVLEE